MLGTNYHSLNCHNGSNTFELKEGIIREIIRKFRLTTGSYWAILQFVTLPKRSTLLSQVHRKRLQKKHYSCTYRFKKHKWKALELATLRGRRMSIGDWSGTRSSAVLSADDSCTNFVHQITIRYTLGLAVNFPLETKKGEIETVTSKFELNKIIDSELHQNLVTQTESKG